MTRKSLKTLNEARPGYRRLNGYKARKIITGLPFRIIKWLISINIFTIAIFRYRNIGTAISIILKITERQRKYFADYQKMIALDGRYYWGLNTPGWPGTSFTRYIHHLMDQYEPDAPLSLHNIILAITNKCGFQCAHCVEWDHLNDRDTLSREQLLEIRSNFDQFGICQLIISGGEPMNRLEDMKALVASAGRKTECWTFTSGYSLSINKADQLKASGLTGVIISLDHWEAGLHDAFRGIENSFSRALEACHNATGAGLLVAFSCCATNRFVSRENLLKYSTICRDAGASFIQFLEPQAAGRYKGMKVSLTSEQQKILEAFFHELNYSETYKDYPPVSYPDLQYKRIEGCRAAGRQYLFINTDGMVQPCPFDKVKVFSALSADLAGSLKKLRNSSCCSISQHYPETLPFEKNEENAILLNNL